LLSALEKRIAKNIYRDPGYVNAKSVPGRDPRETGKFPDGT